MLALFIKYMGIYNHGIQKMEVDSCLPSPSPDFGLVVRNHLVEEVCTPHRAVIYDDICGNGNIRWSQVVPLLVLLYT